MKTEFKGSPAPCEEDKRSRGHVHSNGRSVASCMGYSTNTDDGEHLQENYANAKLIAAALDLLEACLSSLDAQTLQEIEISKMLCYKAINKALS